MRLLFCRDDLLIQVSKMGWNQIFRGTENYMCQMAWERGSGDECREGERWMLTTLGGMKVGCGWDWLRNGLDFISRIWDCISREPGEILSTIVIEWELSPTYQDSPKNSDFCESVQFGLVTQVISDSLQPHGQQHTRLPFASPSPGACANSCP